MQFERLEDRRLLTVSLLNPGFEAGTGTDADNWLEKVDVGTLPGTVVQRVNTAPHGGSFHMVLTVDGSVALPGITSIEQFDPTQVATPGEDYTFSAYVRKASSPWADGLTANLRIQFLDSDGSAGGGVKGEKFVPIGDQLTDEYQKFSAEMVVPAGADSVLVRVEFVGGAFDASDGSIYVDDANLEITGGGGSSGSITGNVFNDPNSNGIKDGVDSNLTSWTVYLDTNNNGALDGGETSATTDTSGNYTFSNLADGTYHVRQVVQSGYRKTLPAQGTPGYDVTTSGSAVTGKDFANTTNIFLGGKVFNDSNSNGTQDVGEAGIGGVVVSIISNNATVASRTTQADGSWKVQGLAAGTGMAQIAVPSGYAATNPIDATYSGSASSGERLGNLNFGIHFENAAPALSNGVPVLVGAEFDLISDVL